MSQLGRIEYAQDGGMLNTDFIDNSAGVDCSDNEVNIKIALKSALDNQKISLEERNILLNNMTNFVSDLSLKANARQNIAINVMENSKIFTVELFLNLIKTLEKSGILNRKVEFLPSDQELIQRKNRGEKLYRPELAVLMSYSKMYVYRELDTSMIPNDEYFENLLLGHFPEILQDKFREEILTHQLRKEIILTEVTNKMVNQVSGPLIFQISLETGALLCDIARSFMIVREIFNLETILDSVKILPKNVPSEVTTEILNDIVKLLRRGITWMIQNLDHPIDVKESIEKFKNNAQEISLYITENLKGPLKVKFENKKNYYISNNVPEELANYSAKLESLISSFDMSLIFLKTNEDKNKICKLYFEVGSEYNLDWLRKSCDKFINSSYWQTVAVQAIKDDLYFMQRELVIKVIESENIDRFDEWKKKFENYVKNFTEYLEFLHNDDNFDINMLVIARKKFTSFLKKL